MKHTVSFLTTLTLAPLLTPFLATAAICLAMTCAAGAAERSLTVRDTIGRDWTDEPITWSVEFNPGEWVFFSPQTFESLLPQLLSRFYPTLTQEWGIGITWMRQPHPQAGTNGVPKEAALLSRNVIGHGSATSAILRVDLDHQLVISQTRRRRGWYDRPGPAVGGTQE